MKDRFKNIFEQFIAKDSSVQELRAASWAEFTDMGLPVIKEERYKYLPVAKWFEEDRFLNTEETFEYELDAPAEDSVVVMLNGSYSPAYTQNVPEGVEILDLHDALKNGHELLKYFAKVSGKDTHKLERLHTATCTDGIIIHVKKNTQLETPLRVESVFSSVEKSFIQGRVLVVVEESAHCVIEETIVSSGDVVVHQLSEVVVGANASCTHYGNTVETEGKILRTVCAQVASDGRYAQWLTSTGDDALRNTVAVHLEGENAHTDLFGLSVLREKQVVDLFTGVFHMKPHTTSNQMVRGIYDGKSTGNFRGRVYVAADAQKVDAQQENKNLLLSESATVNTKPQLEIYADDVKCAHGATIGHLDKESMFYLRSRGLDERLAKGLLTMAFGEEVLSTMEHDTVYDEAHEQLLAVLDLNVLHDEK